MDPLFASFDGDQTCHPHFSVIYIPDESLLTQITNRLGKYIRDPFTDEAEANTHTHVALYLCL